MTPCSDGFWYSVQRMQDSRLLSEIIEHVDHVLHEVAGLIQNMLSRVCGSGICHSNGKPFFDVRRRLGDSVNLV